MERVVALEQARRTLGKLLHDVTTHREAVIIAKKAREKAVLVSYDEYARLKAAEAADAERRFLEALDRIHADVARDGLAPELAEEAVREVRRT